MVDPWLSTLEILAGRFDLPAIAWPAACTRLVVAPGPDDQIVPRYVASPRAEDLAPCSPEEAAVLALLAEFPRSVSEISETLQIKRKTVENRMRKMRKQGLVTHVGAARGAVDAHLHWPYEASKGRPTQTHPFSQWRTP